MSRAVFITSSLSLLLLACGEPAPPAPVRAGVSAPLASGSVTDHGPLAFADPLPLSLAQRGEQHVFHFTLSAPAHIALGTRADASGETVDTVLTLLRGSSPRVIARNDDDGRSRFSRIVRELPAGDYRLRVSGAKRATQGDFLLEVSCAGQGCPPLAPTCLFGDSFYELRNEALLQVLDEWWIRGVEQLDSELEGQQLVIAVQQSSHTDVTTPAEALSRVDQNEVRRMRLRAPGDAREYDVFEYGAGDNSYGAIFRADSLVRAASIQDGDLLECTER